MYELTAAQVPGTLELPPKQETTHRMFSDESDPLKRPMAAFSEHPGFAFRVFG
jgi:hypothetical protein